MLRRGVLGLRVAAAPRDVGPPARSALFSIAASIAACAAALTIRTACLCIDPTLIFLETSRLRTYRSCSVSPT